MFRKEGDKYISDSISLESSDIVLHVELKDNGNIVLERSITGDNWVVAAYLDRKSTRLSSSHPTTSRMPSSA